MVGDGQTSLATVETIGWREATGRTPALLSPLRYPGSKRRLVGVIREAIKANDLKPGLFVEPFAGGASVALQLAFEGTVGEIALADLDPLVTAFWQTVFRDSAWLCEQVDTVEVSVKMWRELRASEPSSRRERALKCLFLNRTSFSGIIGGRPGPIGGPRQESKYTIDCRFNRTTIKARINKAAALATRVRFVRCQSWQATLRAIDKLTDIPGGVFIYADPPFMSKADGLYAHYFVQRQHRALRDGLIQLEKPWLLSYDADGRALDLYSSVPKVVRVEHYYSISKASKRQPAWEMLVTNLDRLPPPRPPRPHVASPNPCPGRG